MPIGAATPTVGHAVRVTEEPAWNVVLEERREGDPNTRVEEWRTEFDPNRHLADDDIRIDLICGLTDGLDYLRISVKSATTQP